MEIILKAFIVNSIDDIEEFNIRVDENNCKIVISTLNRERMKIIDIFKGLKREGTIKSIFIPKNNKIKDKLIKLITIKRQLVNSMDKISEIF
jgi:hypothetical protein